MLFGDEHANKGGQLYILKEEIKKQFDKHSTAARQINEKLKEVKNKDAYDRLKSTAIGEADKAKKLVE